MNRPVEILADDLSRILPLLVIVRNQPTFIRVIGVEQDLDRRFDGHLVTEPVDVPAVFPFLVIPTLFPIVTILLITIDTTNDSRRYANPWNRTVLVFGRTLCQLGNELLDPRVDRDVVEELLTQLFWRYYRAVLTHTVLERIDVGLCLFSLAHHSPLTSGLKVATPNQQNQSSSNRSQRR
ncbi:hypothetical protein D3C85_275530 [compost metagenome]